MSQRNLVDLFGFENVLHDFVICQIFVFMFCIHLDTVHRQIAQDKEEQKIDKNTFVFMMKRNEDAIENSVPQIESSIWQQAPPVPHCSIFVQLICRRSLSQLRRSVLEAVMVVRGLRKSKQEGRGAKACLSLTLSQGLNLLCSLPQRRQSF